MNSPILLITKRNKRQFSEINEGKNKQTFIFYFFISLYLYFFLDNLIEQSNKYNCNNIQNDIHILNEIVDIENEQNDIPTTPKSDFDNFNESILTPSALDTPIVPFENVVLTPSSR